MGISSEGDCPLIRGAVVKMDPTSGAVQNTWYAVPAGCDGGGLWGSITVDTASGTLYFGTGTADPNRCSSPEPYAEAAIALNASDLSLAVPGRFLRLNRSLMAILVRRPIYSMELLQVLFTILSDYRVRMVTFMPLIVVI